jgi:3-hexulose-6-phosphate synthase/6-phospho-3-hexuloisomerase
VSIDVLSVEEAIEVGKRAVRAKADWLEVGTPLILFNGIPVIGQFARAFAHETIFADVKIVDGAKKYVVAAAKEGASLVTVCGIAADATIQQAVAGGRESAARVVVDLYASPDPVRRAREVAEIGADLVYLHYGGDQRAADPDGDNTLDLIALVKQAANVPVGVVTFDTEGGVAAANAGADVVLIGHPYLTGPEAESMLTDYVKRVKNAGRHAS